MRRVRQSQALAAAAISPKYPGDVGGGYADSGTGTLNTRVGPHEVLGLSRVRSAGEVVGRSGHHSEQVRDSGQGGGLQGRGGHGRTAG